MSNAAAFLGEEPEEATLAFYRTVIDALDASGTPFMVGGGFAFSHYTGIQRYTKDMDLFLRPQDAQAALATIAGAGFRAEMVAPHWLGKAYLDAPGADGPFIDVVFSSGNGVAVVDDEWLRHAERTTLLDRAVRLCPVEEMIWSKGYVLERERFDGADIAHLIHARGHRMDWERLCRRFELHWPVLWAHLLLFRFAYPSHGSVVPGWVMRGLLGRLEDDLDDGDGEHRICRGTLLSARQYLVDVERWGYHDARLDPEVAMTAGDIAQLTRDVKAEEARGRNGSRSRGPR